ncbi:hypothetical protein HF086_004204 [Spodoptera exigua]|uniref:Uncharacterized protein n=1 Tax=Spodoptera exigua TaxID=7107 RepID=A0A922SHC2_SPOEX|nr:hypothetical protein HF086_004204 [Spodoptera exigua]
MFNPSMNSYLQLECPINPRLLNKAVRRAMRKRIYDAEVGYGGVLPRAHKLESTQPFLSAPNVDVTVAQLGHGRQGLKLLIHDLSSNKNLTRQRAIHTLLDQVVCPEKAYYLMEKDVVYKLTGLMTDKEPIIREKVAIIFSLLGNHKIGRKEILSRPVFIDNIISMIMEDRKEIRYAASLCLKTLTRDRCAYWDPVKPLKMNAFQVLKRLLLFNRNRVVQAAMDCLAVLCRHEIGKKLADSYDLNKLLLYYLYIQNVPVVRATLGLLQYTTITTRSKWRAKEFAQRLIRHLTRLTYCQTQPLIQLRAMQVLINLCDNADMRVEVKEKWNVFKELVRKVDICPDEQFVNTTEYTTFTEKTGLNYETMCIEPVDIITDEYGSDAEIGDASSYIDRIHRMMHNLEKAMNANSYTA